MRASIHGIFKVVARLERSENKKTRRGRWIQSRGPFFGSSPFFTNYSNSNGLYMYACRTKWNRSDQINYNLNQFSTQINISKVKTNEKHKLNMDFCHVIKIYVFCFLSDMSDYMRVRVRVYVNRRKKNDAALNHHFRSNSSAPFLS